METSETSVGTGFVGPEDRGQAIVSIVVPAFNEAHRIAETVRKIDDFIRRSRLALEFIIVRAYLLHQASMSCLQMPTFQLRLKN